MPGLESAPILIDRWLGHGDVWLIVDADEVFVRADQLERLASIPRWSGGEALFGTDWHIRDGVEYYRLEDALSRCENAGTPDAAEFVTWLQGRLQMLVSEEAVERARRLPGLVGAFTVSGAADELTMRLGFRLGRQHLFGHMSALGWICRDAHGDWVICDARARESWLATRPVTVPATERTGKRLYEQIYVTPAGIDELASRLTPDPVRVPSATVTSAPPTLFD